MFVVLADANTSAGAPCPICSASPELGPKLNTTFVPGCAASNWEPSLVNASCSDDAANTLIVPVTDADLLADGDAGEPVEPLDPPHPATSVATATRAVSGAAMRRTGLLL